MYARIRALFSHPRADHWVLLIATLLVVPSIPTGLAADDFWHEIVMSGSDRIPGFHPGTLDLFRFGSPDSNISLMNDGVFPWWADPEVRFAFFRPLGALTHFLDFTFFRGSPALWHVHSILWGLAGLFGVRALYRSVGGAGWGASLALAFYALDDTRGPPIAWIANRAEIVGFALSVWAVTLHVRSRRDPKHERVWLAPLCLFVSLFASEGSIAVTAYLFAHALFLEEGPLSRRLGRLAPFFAVVVAWATVYRGLGYGVRWSGVYFDPISTPALFFEALPKRFAMLWLSQLGGPWAEGWNMFPVMLPALAAGIAVLAVAALVLAVVLFGPLVRRDPHARFWALGAVLATVPACTAFPADRLLPWVGIGATGLAARFLEALVEGRLDAPRPYHAVARVGGACVILVQLVLGPLLLPLRARGIVQVRETLQRADDSVPTDPSIEQRVVWYVNPPADPLASYIFIARAARGDPNPRAQHWLVTGTGAATFQRVDARTLRVHIDGGLLRLPSELLFRSVAEHPFRPGDEIRLRDVEVTIVGVTPDGRPTDFLARLDKDLEDPSHVWLVWRDGQYRPYSPPAIGEESTVPAADWLTTTYGPKSPITRALRREWTTSL